MYTLQPDTLNNSNGSSPIAVASTGVVYTKAHAIDKATVFGISALLSSTLGTPNVQIDMQVSDTAPDAKEGIADSDNTDWCVQEGGATILTVNDKVLHKITISPTPSKFMRLKLTGIGSNPADTTGVFKLITQQQL